MLCCCWRSARSPFTPKCLTASDGTGLSLVELEANAVVTDPLAFTELHLVFQNPEDRLIEGQFRIVLPQHAVVSRFAMKQDTRWQEGEVVEKQAARRAYEDALHRRQDPALLEQGAANEFSARVFPIGPRAKKELIISYSQQLVASGSSYVLPLKGLPQITKLSVTVTGGASPVTLTKASYVPTADVSVAASSAGSKGLRTGDYAVFRVKPVSDAASQPIGGLLVLFDTSASRALGYSGQVALLQKVIGKLPPTTPVTVAAFDQTVKPLFDGVASGFDAAAVKALRDRRALGASNLEMALAYAQTQSRPRVVLLGDGVVTAGLDAPDELAAKVKGLKAAGVTRFDAIAVGGLRDEALLQRLVTAGLPQDGAIIDGDATEAEIVRRLQLQTHSKISVSVEGASFQWPKTLSAMQAGDEALIFAELPKGKPVSVKVAGAAIDTSGLGEVSVAMLERSVAQAKIEAMTDDLNRKADGDKDKARFKAEITALSVKYRVLSQYTALLVLETEADYARFGIDRKALADILGIEKGRVVAMHREALPAGPPMVKAPVPQPVEKAKKAAPSRSAAGNEAFAEPMKEAKEEATDDGAPAPGAAPAPSEAPVSAPPASPSSVASAPPPPRPSAGSPSSTGAAPRSRDAARPQAEQLDERAESEGGGGSSGGKPQQGPPPYTGPFKEVMALLSAHKNAEAMNKALGWREEAAGDVLALVAIGEAAEAAKDLERAARAYGSIIDLFPARADLRRFAGVRLERLAEGLALATDSYRHALEQRPDHPQSARLLAYALLKQGKPEQAFEVLATARARSYPSGRFAGIERILGEDLGLAAAAWGKAQPDRKADIEKKLKLANGSTENSPSIRFVLNWETDANDVDFHIFDAHGGHAFYSSPHLRTGGDLYADVTTGYGPECFTIRGKTAGPYTLQAHYYSRGPMGYGMGKLEIVEHDGKGTLRFEERPFIVMVDEAFVNLGTVK